MELGSMIFIGVGVLFAVLLIFWIISKLKGRITITLNSFEYSKGDTITGKINLKLRNPTLAKALNVSLIGQQTNSNGFVGKRSSQTKTIFNFSKPIDGEKTYPAGESNYDFQIKVPSNITGSQTGNAIADTLIKSAQILTGAGTIRWYVQADLEVSGFNITKKVQINIA